MLTRQEEKFAVVLKKDQASSLTSSTVTIHSTRIPVEEELAQEDEAQEWLRMKSESKM